jgi:BirA family biotin operon repressor/biotin-[acetyl-CoA-carboxylase] ligase
MNTGVLIPGDPMHSPSEAAKTCSLDGWAVHEYSSVHSTNLVAANLPPWNAVRADTQTAGRGRFERSWVSDQGGLWLSATLPCQNGKPAPRSLPLSVGLAVCEALQSLRVANLRMRWPNDLLVDGLKLAGILLDQLKSGSAIAGIGINVHNHPEIQDDALKNLTVRLADLLPACPELSQLTREILGHLRGVHQELLQFGFSALLPRVNRLWGPPRWVEIDLDGQRRRGLFTNVDQDGRLLLAEPDGASSAYEPNAVRHLIEI